MIDYFVKSFIYVIIIFATMIVFKMLHPNFKGNSNTTKKQAWIFLIALSLVPFLRFFVALLIGILCFISDKTLEEIIDKQNRKE